MSNQEKFEAMLALDKKTFEILASLQLFLADPKSKSSPNYDAVKQRYESLNAAYTKRQEDYKNNTLYKIGASITEYSDKTVQWFKDTWNKFFGIGVAPLVVPVAIVAGATITATALGYFIYSYYTETSVNYNEGLETLALIAKDNPELAEKLRQDLSKAKKEENESGLFNSLGKGLKTSLIVLSIGAVVVGGVYVYKQNQ